MLIVGITGTRNGMTAAQRNAVEHILSTGQGEFHHGDCVGADEQAHLIAKVYGWNVVIHPPTDPKLRAFCTGGTVLREYPYIKRNRHIVDASRILLAAPSTMEEEVRSGTWSTVRYARSRGIPRIIIFPTGTTTKES